MTCCERTGTDNTLNVSAAFLAPRLHTFQFKLLSSTPLRSSEDSRGNSAIATPPAPSTARPPVTRASPCPASHALTLPRSWGLPHRCHHHYHPRHRHRRRGLHQRGTVRESIQPMGRRQRAAGGSEGAGTHRGAMENGLGSERRHRLERKG